MKIELTGFIEGFYRTEDGVTIKVNGVTKSSMGKKIDVKVNISGTAEVFKDLKISQPISILITS